MTSFRITRLQHVQLAIPPGGEQASRSFWVDALGFIEVPKPPMLAVRGGCWFRLGDLEMHMGIEEPFVPARKAHPALLATDLDALAARLTEAGGEVRWSQEVPGTKRFHTDDPFGNRLEFIEDVP
ncbi:MAG TPA: VOC family protein [Tetrasphaera sp.]|jgi:catechol 2,3-dioxygenase-like lactoylglutathione lyase family enzyme|uniref:VOC family protein n=1 Tax=Nostocoides sp. TaxID=1917966 RepID=UPI002D1B97FF|nr:VOC family protein [Tetrasphaera sp.]HNQ06933.1 VOC family protein [Tetrasphaera sp.]